MVKSEIKFLEGPQSRWKDFTFAVKVLIEFIRGFRALHHGSRQQGRQRCWRQKRGLQHCTAS